MRPSSSILLVIAKRISLLGIYALFFTVQFFFNFKSDTTEQNTKALYEQAQIAKQKNIVANKSDHNKKPGIRLNKRFQPSMMPAMAYAGEDIPLKYLDQEKIGKPHDYLLISFILATSLRGPPVLS